MAEDSKTLPLQTEVEEGEGLESSWLHPLQDRLARFEKSAPGGSGLVCRLPIS
jgi:hypothetical protein